MKDISFCFVCTFTERSEISAYASVVSAFRAQGPLTETKKNSLDLLCKHFRYTGSIIDIDIHVTYILYKHKHTYKFNIHCVICDITHPPAIVYPPGDTELRLGGLSMMTYSLPLLNGKFIIHTLTIAYIPQLNRA